MIIYSYVYCAILAMGLGICLAENGKITTKKESFGKAIFGVMLQIPILGRVLGWW